MSDTQMTENYPDAMSLDDFFLKAGFDPGPFEGYININFLMMKGLGCQKVGDLKGGNRLGGWRTRVDSDFIKQIDLKLGIKPQTDSPISDDSKSEEEPEFDNQVHAKLSERWKSEISRKISLEKENKDHPFNFENDVQILARQKQVYVGLEDDIMPYSEGNVTVCDMLYGTRYDRKVQEAEEPVFVRISSEMETKVSIKVVGSLNDVSSIPALEKSPLYVVVQQRGAGKTFEIYSAARNSFVLFFNMSTSRDSSSANPESTKSNINTSRASATNPVVRNYYKEIKRAMKSKRLDDEEKYDKTVDLTFKLVYASIFHFIEWKLLHPNKNPIDWFRYSFCGQSVLFTIFQDILPYEIDSLGTYMQTIISKSDFFDFSKLVISFDEAGELTTDKPAKRNFLPRRRSNQDKVEPKYSLFHPFIDAMLQMSDLKMHRFVSGTTLSLSHVSLGTSSALKPGDVTLLMISSLFRTSDTEIKQAVSKYFPNLEFLSDKRRNWIGRSRFLYDILIPKLFEESYLVRKRNSDDKEGELELQSLFDEKHDAWFDIAIERVRGYISIYAGRKFQLEDETPFTFLLKDLLHDVVMGCRSKHAVEKDDAAALIDCGVMYCMEIKDNGTIELVQHELAAVKAIIRFYEQYRTTYIPVTSSSTSVDTPSSAPKRQRTSTKEDPIIEYCLKKFKGKAEGLPTVFENFMMRHIQLSLSICPSIYDNDMLGHHNDDLKFYKLIVDQFINESSGINFRQYLTNSQKYKTIGFFPPNLALADGALPIVKRDLKEMLANVYDPVLSEEIRKKHEELPAIRFLFLQFKLYTSSIISTGIMKHAVRTVNPYHFYTNSKGHKTRQRLELEQILKLNTQPLLDLCNYSVGFVVTAGNISGPAANFARSQEGFSIFHVDAEAKLPPPYSSIVAGVCRDYQTWCQSKAKELYEGKEYVKLLRYEFLNWLNAAQICVVAKNIYPSGKEPDPKHREEIIDFLVTTVLDQIILKASP